MKTTLVHTLAVLLLLIGVNRAAAQGTAFTYQGQLTDNGAPANGLFDIRGGIYTNITGGTLQTELYTNLGVVVTNGLFTVTFDFGSDIFDGNTNWLQIGVRTNGAANFTPLSPRQELTPTPYAIFAEGANAAGLTGTIPMTSLSGTYGATLDLTNTGNSYAGSGAGLTGVNAATLDGLNASNFWSTTGNAGTSPSVNFVGTTDDEPLTLESYGEPGLQIQYWNQGSILANEAFGMNVIAGYWGNSATNTAVGVTIAGGGYESRFGLEFPPLFSTYPNTVTGSYGTVGGGYGNSAGAGATVPGGIQNIASAPGSFAAGQYAQTTLTNTFIWSDGSQNPFVGANAQQGFDVLASGGVFFYNGSNGVSVDHGDLNDGTIYYGLRFGEDSGEGIASRRVAGNNLHGLDFYTSFNNRMCISNNGFVGINTTTPTQRLEVNGNFVQIDGANADDGNGPIDAFIGGNGSGSDVQVGSMNSNITTVAFYNWGNSTWMHISCSEITIEGGSDLAEPFPVSGSKEDLPEGSVMVIDAKHPGQLKLSTAAYDPRVAGVLSGANGVKPGIQMQQQGVLEGGKNVALSGRVYVLADASNGAIEPGDLLTSSETPGHAMKVTDHAKAQGAILGKAMTSLEEGKGMVLVLVTLQ